MYALRRFSKLLKDERLKDERFTIVRCLNLPGWLHRLEVRT